MEKITYTVSVKDLVAKFDECEYVKIEFDADGDYDILDENAYGFPEDCIYTLHFERFDFEECNNDVKQYADWLYGSQDYIEVQESPYDDEPQYGISINFVE